MKSRNKKNRLLPLIQKSRRREMPFNNHRISRRNSLKSIPWFSRIYRRKINFNFKLSCFKWCSLATLRLLRTSILTCLSILKSINWTKWPQIPRFHHLTITLRASNNNSPNNTKPQLTNRSHKSHSHRFFNPLKTTLGTLRLFKRQPPPTKFSKTRT